MLSAIITPVPLPYLIASAFIVAAMTALLLINIDRWWSAANPSGKLNFEHPTYGIQMSDRDGNQYLDVFQIGLYLKNQANYPITYEVENITSIFNGRIAQNKQFNNLGQEIAAQSVSTFRDNAIQVDMPIEETTYQADVDFTISYFRSKRRKFKMNKKIRVFCLGIPQERRLQIDWVYV